MTPKLRRTAYVLGSLTRLTGYRKPSATRPAIPLLRKDRGGDNLVQVVSKSPLLTVDKCRHITVGRTNDATAHKFARARNGNIELPRERLVLSELTKDYDALGPEAAPRPPVFANTLHIVELLSHRRYRAPSNSLLLDEPEEFI